MSTFFRLLVFLIPTPLVHLWFCQTCSLRNFKACLLCPVWVFLILLHQVLHLIWILSVPLFSSTFSCHHSPSSEGRRSILVAMANLWVVSVRMSRVLMRVDNSAWVSRRLLMMSEWRPLLNLRLIRWMIIYTTIVWYFLLCILFP